ncbi:MAG: excinuclease ABC subunit UvrB [Candidatus Marinimicrobia bacterium]|nr:excinuclease ABC subunit UvrB [Candidatus Neomarinimicrobiota bacterium]MBL7022675.1 excinuclease ABC subunit UvrB [Candidatus Neomarinimicrobiota bacterium]MBL7109931.1 excinuclease ABC subunit UvrB [Candidatus Neomarinimicrobiota bacterium]
MADFNIQSPFNPTGDQPRAIRQIVNGILNGDKAQTLLGITGSGKTFTMANIIQELQRPTLIFSHNKVLAAQLYGEFKSLFPDNAVEFFISYYDYYQPEAYMPVSDTFIEKDSSIDEEIDRLRLKATASLMARRDVIIVASVSCIYGIGSRDDYKKMMVRFTVGQTVEVKSKLRELVNIHYGRNDLVLEPGVFRMRGDILEIFPAYENIAIRIELFGDEVEAIHYFDPLTGEINNSVDSVFIYPAKHFVTTSDNLKRAMNDIRKELGERLELLRNENKLLEAQRLEQRTWFDLEMMTELGYCSGIENYSRHIDGRKAGEPPQTLMDFFPDDYLLFVDESHVSMPQVRGMHNGDRARKENLVDYGFRLPSAFDNRPLRFPEFENRVNQAVFVSATPSDYELEKSNGVIVEQIIRPTGLLDPRIEVRKTNGQIDNVIGEINSVVQNNERVLITTLTKKMAENLTDYLMNANIQAKYLHDEIATVERVQILRGLRLKEFDVLVGINLLREGLDLPEVSRVLVLDADKEGFLRSKTSLMQVAGRAARNANSKVIFYAERITKSMQFVIDETTNRRKIQDDYNKKNGITPKTIYKSVDDIKISTAVADEQSEYITKENLDLSELTLEDIEEQDILETIKKRMLKCARELQFEQAAILRDKIEELEKKFSR